MNGKHSSAMLAELNGDLPAGLKANLLTFSVNSEMELAELFQDFDNFCCRGRAFVSSFRVQSADQIGERRRDVWIDDLRSLWILRHDQIQRRTGLVIIEWGLASNHRVQHAPQAEQVGTVIHHRSARLFR